MRKVARTHAEKFPSAVGGGGQLKFMGKKPVFTDEALGVIIGGQFVEQSCLTEKEGFDLQQVVAVLVDCL